MDASLAVAAEENAIAFLLALGRAGGGDERRDPRVHWTIGGSPIAYHNCVVRADLTPASADAEIVASIEAMQRRGVPGSWHVGPSMQPSDLGARLVAHGFDSGDEPAMAADLTAIPDFAGPSGLRIDRVSSEADLDSFAAVLAAGFGEGPKEAEWVHAMYSRIGLGDDVDWRHYLGSLDGRPVATASTFFAAGVAGVYFVCTEPDVRGRGIGLAITRHAMVAAQQLGFAAAVLGSSPMGHGVYRRLGFADVCTVGVYEWTPGNAADEFGGAASS